MISGDENIIILYVDDEAHNLSAFKASFRRNYEIHLANSAADAMKLLEEIRPHIIITDQRMPEVTGIEFFEKIKDSHPYPIRILLTAYTSSQTVIDAVNKGQIDRYLVKPWNNDIMSTTLAAGYSMYQARVALYKKNEELKKTNSELNRFVYSVSHDLRAPLMSMLGLINLAKMDEECINREQYFDLMEKSVSKMDNYIQTTLEYYRNFKSEIAHDYVNVDELLRELMESLESVNTDVQFDYQFLGNPEVMSDRMRLKICCANLFSNAVKYGKNGEGKYTVDIMAENDNSQLSIKVTDRGIGISKEDMPYIYDMFYRSSGSQSAKSTGLGLYLVKEAVNRIGGKIDVESVLGMGTTFTLKFPLN